MESPATVASVSTPVSVSNSQPVTDIALEVRRKMETGGRTVAQIMAEYGRSDRWVRDMLALASLPIETLKDPKTTALGYRKLIKLARGIRPTVKNSKKGTISAEAFPNVTGGSPGNAAGTDGNAKEPVISPKTPPKTADGNTVSTVETLETVKETLEVRKNNLGNAQETPETPDSPHPLLRRTVNWWSQTFLWWTRSHNPAKPVEAGALAEDWLVYFGRKGWLMIGLTVGVLGFELCGAYRVTSYIQSHAADFWHRFKVAAFRAPAQTGGMAPIVTDSHFVAGHEMEMKWTPISGVLKYRLYWHQNGSISHLGDDVETPGAIIDVPKWFGEGSVSVTGIGVGNIETAHSNTFLFIPTDENQNVSVQALPESEMGASAPGEGTTNSGTGQNSRVTKGQSHPTSNSQNGGKPNPARPSVSESAVPLQTGGGASSPLVSANDATSVFQSMVPDKSGIAERLGNAFAAIAGKSVASATTPAPGRPGVAAPSYAGPTGLTWKPIAGSRDIQLSWQDLGPGYHYNVYCSYATDTPSFDRDGYLLKEAHGAWTPPAKGTQVFLFYVTAVNPQGQESAPSQRIMVDLR